MLYVIVEGALHQAVCAERLLYVPFEPFLGVKFDGLEVLDVQGVKEHVPHSSFFLVDPEGVPGQDDSLEDASERVGGESDSCGHYLVTLG